MGKDLRILIGCCMVIMGALVLVVGVESHGVLRHIVQTSPLWIAVVLGIRRSALATWAALPCLAIWLFLMIAILLYVLGWAQILFIRGTFTPVEIAMTVLVAIASLAGIIVSLRTRSGAGALRTIAIMSLVTILQVGAIWLSFLPSIAHR
jgi:hypothetical protein